jgi:hypothetical protein
MPPSCRAWRCRVCGPQRLRRCARAIDNAGYERFVTLTRAPKDARQGIARVRYLLARDRAFEWVWGLERGERTGMIHAHLCVRSGYVAQSEISLAARRAGWGRVAHVQRVLPATHAASYAAKAAYTAKASLRPEAWEDHISLNGNRGFHWSRGYTNGMGARAFVAYYAPPHDPGPWVWVARP